MSPPFPVGHYAGERPGGHLVRLGASAQPLSVAEFEVWMRAHGLGRAEPKPGLVAGLLRRGLLAAPRAAAHGEAFARRHRMGSLLSGRGDTAEAPGRYGVGIPGAPAVAWLDAEAHALWTWGPVAANLWQLCLGGDAEPEDALSVLLRQLRVLLRHGCAYLDLSVPAPDVAMTDWCGPRLATSEQG